MPSALILLHAAGTPPDGAAARTAALETVPEHELTGDVQLAGAYDAALTVETSTPETLARLVERLQARPEILRTLTLVEIPDPDGEPTP